MRKLADGGQESVNRGPSGMLRIERDCHDSRGTIMSKNRNGGFSGTGRREFLQMSAVSAAAVAGLNGDRVSARLNTGDTTSEDLVRQLYASLSEQQRAEV